MILGNYYHANKWVEVGHKVSIATASFSHARRVNPEGVRFFKSQDINGVTFFWLRTFSHSGASRIGRIANLIIFPVVFFLYVPFAIRTKYDVVICSLPNPFLSIPAFWLARLSRARFIVEVRDIWPETLVEMGGASSSNLLIRLLKKISLFAYRKADAIVSVLPNMNTYLSDNNIDKRSIHIPNGCLPNSVGTRTEIISDEYQRIVSLIKKLKINNDFVIGYTGKLGISNGIGTMLKSLALVENASVKLVIVGDGDLLQQMKDYANELGVSDKVFFVGSVAHSEVDPLLGYFDALLVCVSKSPLYKYGLSLTKISEYMLAGRPVIYSADDPDSPVELSGCGISCKAQDYQSIASAIDKLALLSEGRLSDIGKLGRIWAMENRSYDVLSERYLRVIKTI